MLKYGAAATRLIFEATVRRQCSATILTGSHFRSLSSRRPELDTDETQQTPFERKLAESKERLQWRTPYNERDTEWYSKFKVFAPKKNEDTDIIAFLQQPIDFSLSTFQEKNERKRVKTEKYMQQFMPERHQMLGNDLAVAHFLVHRGGAVKFINQQVWTQQSEDGSYTLPSRFDANWLVEAIRCDGMELYYEGLENIRRLTKLKFLSFHNVKPFDDWCMDRISGSEFDVLEVLDISGTQVTERGLQALYRLPTLRVLIVDDAQQSKAMELTCAMLEELMPNLKITNAGAVHDKEIKNN